MPKAKNIILFDCESNLDGLITTMCITPVRIGVPHMFGETHKFIANDMIDLQLDMKTNFRKVVQEMNEYADHTYHGTFNECLGRLLSIVKKYKNCVFMSHSLDKDISFILKSDRGSHFKRNLLNFPEDFPVSLVCSQRLLNERCPNFQKATFCDPPCSKLAHYVAKLDGRDQKHTSVSDVRDLYDVLVWAWDLDHFEIPRGSYLYRHPA